MKEQVFFFLLYVHIRSNTEEMLKKDCSTVLRSYEKAYVINKDSIAEISSDLEKISEELLREEA